MNDLENKTCIVLHAKIPNCFYNGRTKKFTNNVNQATRYSTDIARKEVIEEIQKEYPKFKPGMCIFHYM